MSLNRFDVVLFAFVLGVIIAMSTAQAATWHVRPYSVTEGYGAQDGATFDDAWNGLGTIAWGVGGVRAGDTLCVHGMHPDPDTSPMANATVADHTILTVNGSGEDGYPIIIDGQCSENVGSILRVSRMYLWDAIDFANHGWTAGVHDTFSRSAGGSTNQPLEYVDAFDTVEALIRAGGTPAQAPSVWMGDGLLYHDTGTSTLYYKPSQYVSRSRVFVDAVSVALEIAGQDYITVKNLQLYGGTSGRGLIVVRDGADYVTLHHNAFRYAGYDSIRINDSGASAPVHNLTIHDNRIVSPNRAGIYMIHGGQQSDSHHYFNNLIMDCDPKNERSGHQDDHGIVLERGDGHIVEDNTIVDCAMYGIGLDYGSSHTQRNNIIRNNWVDCSNCVNHPFGFGIGVMGRNELTPAPEYTAGNQIYGNLITNYPNEAIHISSAGHDENGGDIRVYNNTVRDADVCLRYHDIFRETVHHSGLVFQNNICDGITHRHVDHSYSPETNDWSDTMLDYNLWHPDGPSMFSYQGMVFDYDGFRNRVGMTARVIESHSPRPANPYFHAPDALDFTLQRRSMAIDSGVDMGSPWAGTAPDIGAFELL